MRIIGEIPHKDCKISIFHWNEKYLIKFELGLYEQTYKIDEFEVESDEALKSLIDEVFIQKIMKRFDEMHQDWNLAIN